MVFDDLINAFYRICRGKDLPSAIPSRVLLGAACRRFPQLIRGLFFGFLQHGSILLVFRGRRVRVVNPGLVSLGRYVSLADGVEVSGYSRDGVVLGARVTVGKNALISASGVLSEPGIGVVVGERTSIGLSNVIWGQGGVVIGSSCLFGPNVVVVSEDHSFRDVEVPIWAQGSDRAGVVIGNDCWIGAGVVITKGVRIGDGCVIGANSVVNSDFGPGSVVVGSPAKAVGNRFRPSELRFQ